MTLKHAYQSNYPYKPIHGGRKYNLQIPKIAIDIITCLGINIEIWILTLIWKVNYMIIPLRPIPSFIIITKGKLY